MSFRLFFIYIPTEFTGHAIAMRQLYQSRYEEQWIPSTGESHILQAYHFANRQFYLLQSNWAKKPKNPV
jgi:hypothetical protein